MPTKKASKTSTPKSTVSSRASSKSSTSKKGTGKKATPKRSSPGLISKAKKVAGAVVKGAAAGAVRGAVQGAVEAGTQATGLGRKRQKGGEAQRRISKSGGALGSISDRSI
jgi:hypothetical protein